MKNEPTFDEVIRFIIHRGYEERAVRKLLGYIFKQRHDAENLVSHNEACLRAIKKINENKTKDEAISSLTEPPTPDWYNSEPRGDDGAWCW